MSEAYHSLFKFLDAFEREDVARYFGQEQEVEDLVKRTDLEEETILDVIRILKEEFED
mgnify:CR=1 FL=1